MNKHIALAMLIISALALAGSAQAAVITTTFDQASGGGWPNPAEPLTDGRDPGYNGTTSYNADTVNGWTYYYEGGTAGNTGVISLDAGSIGNYATTLIETRLGILANKTRGVVTGDVANLEEGGSGSVAAIIQTFEAIDLGGGVYAEVTIDITMLRAERTGKGLAWVMGESTNFASFDYVIPNVDNASYSVSFTPTAPTFQIGFFGNTNNDTNASINSITVSGVVPEPATMALLALGGLAVLGRKRRVA